ncbi:MAG: 3'-5' exonuclease [Mycoplasmataceae bacterium]|nr:3'-5' exonuclease [Mycoplasmataceae bacterium]
MKLDLSNINKRYLVIDIETTGFKPGVNSIIEVGAILTDGNLNVLKTYESFVRCYEIPFFITNLTGITASDTSYAPEIKEVLVELNELAKDATVIAHYAPFDKSFIRHYLDECNIEYTPTEWVDSINVFKKAFPQMFNYKLATLIKYFGLADKEDHRALSDARHTLTILQKAHGLD